jgi:hypothetical protein
VCTAMEGRGKIADPKSAKQTITLLTLPLDAYKNVPSILSLKYYPQVVCANATDLPTT